MARRGAPGNCQTRLLSNGLPSHPASFGTRYHQGDGCNSLRPMRLRKSRRAALDPHCHAIVPLRDKVSTSHSDTGDVPSIDGAAQSCGSTIGAVRGPRRLVRAVVAAFTLRVRIQSFIRLLTNDCLRHAAARHWPDGRRLHAVFGPEHGGATGQRTPG